jgi:uncharacterized protein
VGCVFLAAVCQTALGFGFALVLVPLLSLFWDLKGAIAVSLLLSAVSSVLTVADLWRQARWRVVAGLFAGSWVGVPIGAALLVLASPSLLRLLVASIILVSTLVTLRGVTLGQPRRPVAAALIVGAISGLLRSATSMGGPPVALYLLGMRYPPAAFVGTNASFYLLGSGVSIAALAITGRVTERELTISLTAVPALLVGAWIGRHLRTRLAERVFRSLAAGLLLATSGAILAPFLVRAGTDLLDRLW